MAKSITRNELCLTQDYSEQFHDESFNSNVILTVEEGDGESCMIRMFKGDTNECDFVSFILSKEDAERFAQAVLIHSGARKVVKSQVFSIVNNGGK